MFFLVWGERKGSSKEPRVRCGSIQPISYLAYDDVSVGFFFPSMPHGVTWSYMYVCVHTQSFSCERPGEGETAKCFSAVSEIVFFVFNQAGAGLILPRAVGGVFLWNLMSFIPLKGLREENKTPHFETLCIQAYELTLLVDFQRNASSEQKVARYGLAIVAD